MTPTTPQPDRTPPTAEPLLGLTEFTATLRAARHAFGELADEDVGEFVTALRANGYTIATLDAARSPLPEADALREALRALIETYHRDMHGYDEVPIERCQFAHCEGVLAFLAGANDDSARWRHETHPDHQHGGQDCDPSEAAAIAQFERDEGPLVIPPSARQSHVLGTSVSLDGAPDDETGGHVLVGLTCWCAPYRDAEEPAVIVHRGVARG